MSAKSTAGCTTSAADIPGSTTPTATWPASASPSSCGRTAATASSSTACARRAAPAWPRFTRTCPSPCTRAHTCSTTGTGNGSRTLPRRRSSRSEDRSPQPCDDLPPRAGEGPAVGRARDRAFGSGRRHLELLLLRRTGQRRRRRLPLLDRLGDRVEIARADLALVLDRGEALVGGSELRLL